MRRKDKEMTDRNEILKTLKSAEICRIGLSRDNVPYVVPMYFASDGEYLYLHSASEGMKLDIMKENPQVCFEVETGVKLISAENACDWEADFKTVIGWGTAEILTDPNERIDGLKKIILKYAGENQPMKEQSVPKTAVIRIKIGEITGKHSVM